MAKPKPKPKPVYRPPANLYDPALDANLRATDRGLQNLIDDTTLRDQPRLTEDWITGQGDIARQRTELGEDITRQRSGVETDYGRNLTDLLTQRTQGTEDYTRNLSQLQRNYDSLGNQQKQGISAAGLSQGGAGAQAARKRVANQAWERAPIDTNQNRFLASSQLNEGRLGEDRSTALSDILRSETRGGQALDRSLGQLNQNYGRQYGDLGVGMERARTEAQEFGINTAASKVGQAINAGWDPRTGQTQAQKFAQAQKRAKAAAVAAAAKARAR